MPRLPTTAGQRAAVEQVEDRHAGPDQHLIGKIDAVIQRELQATAVTTAETAAAEAAAATTPFATAVAWPLATRPTQAGERGDLRLLERDCQVEAIAQRAARLAREVDRTLVNADQVAGGVAAEAVGKGGLDRGTGRREAGDRVG